MTKREVKKKVKAEFLSDKEKKVIKEMKLKRKEVFLNSKKNGSDKEATKQLKLEYKYYKKLKNRPVKYSILAILCLLLLFLGFKAAPYIGDIRELLDVKINSDTQEAIAAREKGEILAEKISDEGIVLLKNEGNLLPLQNKKVNVFGFGAIDFKYGGAGSGGADQSRSATFFEGLNLAGIEYNQELFAFYNSKQEELAPKNESGLKAIIASRFGKGNQGEPEIGYLSDDVILSAKAYSDTAIIVLSSASTESADIAIEDLKMDANQMALIDKVATQFENVIIMINSGNTMELGFVDTYASIKSVLWVGTPGPKGTISIGKILTGAVNPSGRLTDTYVYDLTTHPASVTYGDFKYNNIEKMAFLNYSEGIYVGYRYFETFYQGNEDAYQTAVQYPFGFGLSYTQFDWQVENYQTTDDMIKVDVKVTNTGAVEGKDVVEVYFTPPYYEGGIEKAAVELAGYAKTSLIQPGASETVTIQFSIRDMASYAMDEREAYVLEKGNYEIRLSKNAHETVETLNYEVAADMIYKTDETTGTELENQFDIANGGLTYLSRSDWEGTYPNTSQYVYEAPQEVVDAFYARPEKNEGETTTTGVNNNLMLKDLVGVPYDDAKWNAYVEQFTIEEMIEVFTHGGWKTLAVERLGLPETLLLDGPAGINFFFSKLTAASYPTEIIIAATWNDALAYEMGVTIGEEAKALGVDGWYAPGINIHRVPQGGRNFEYYSEDPLLAGKMAANMVKGAQTNKIMVFIKHFVMNDQEMNARKGVMVWANEQAMREIYLRPFEITVKEGEATAVMSSFTHLGPIWSSGNDSLLNQVLREEWGFTGIVSSDAVQAHFMDPELALRNGNDLMLNPLPSIQEKDIKALYKEDPVGVAIALKERMKAISFSILNYTSEVVE